MVNPTIANPLAYNEGMCDSAGEHYPFLNVRNTWIKYSFSQRKNSSPTNQHISLISINAYPLDQVKCSSSEVILFIDKLIFVHLENIFTFEKLKYVSEIRIILKKLKMYKRVVVQKKLLVVSLQNILEVVNTLQTWDAFWFI